MKYLKLLLLLLTFPLLQGGCVEAQSTTGSGSGFCCRTYEVVVINNTQYRLRAESSKEKRTIQPFRTATFYWKNVSDWGYDDNNDVVISAVRLNSSGGIVPGLAHFSRNKDSGDTDHWELDNGDFKFKD